MGIKVAKLSKFIKKFKKLILIARVNCKTLITFQKIEEFLPEFGQIYKNNWNLYPTSGAGRSSPMLANFCDCFLNFILVTISFPKIRGSAPGDQLTIHYLKCKGVREAKPPPSDSSNLNFLHKNRTIPMVLKIVSCEMVL